MTYMNYFNGQKNTRTWRVSAIKELFFILSRCRG